LCFEAEISEKSKEVKMPQKNFELAITKARNFKIQQNFTLGYQKDWVNFCPQTFFVDATKLCSCH
jgi:hypothetical protein